jgi:hypothetical protein
VSPLRLKRDARALHVCSGSSGGAADEMHCSKTVLLMSTSAMKSRLQPPVEAEVGFSKSEHMMLQS